MSNKIRTCRHLRANGQFCGSPALRHNTLCYYHYRLAQREQRRLRLGGPVDAAANTGIELPLLEDADSIQIAINEVTRAIIDQRIDHRRAGLLLYSFQLALQNTRNLRPMNKYECDPYVLDIAKSQWEGVLEEPVDPDSRKFRVKPETDETVANAVPPILCDDDCEVCEADHCEDRHCSRKCDHCHNPDCLDKLSAEEQKAHEAKAAKESATFDNPDDPDDPDDPDTKALNNFFSSFHACAEPPRRRIITERRAIADARRIARSSIHKIPMEIRVKSFLKKTLISKASKSNTLRTNSC